MSLIRKLPGLGDVAKRNDDKELIADLEKLFDAAREDRMQYEGQWMVNLAFFLGHQWLVFDSVTRRMRQVQFRGESWRVRMVMNLVRQQVLTKYAKLVQSRPQAKAQPASDDVEDRQQAEVCDAILGYLEQVDGSEEAVKRALLWAVVTGTGILQATWNTGAGAPLTHPDTTFVSAPDPTTGEPVQQEVPHPKAGQPVTTPQGDPVHLGEIEVADISPLEFYPDPHGLTIGEKSWYFVQKLRSPEYVMERYGIEVEARDIPADEFFDGQMLSLMGGGLAPKRGVIVKTFRQRPVKKYPEGRYVTYVSDQVLYQGPNPYPKAPVPCAAFVDTPVPGRFWGDSTVTDMIDPQRNLNKSRSQAIEIRNLMAKPQYWAPKLALDPGQQVTNEPGAFNEYNVVPNALDGGRPSVAQGATIPDAYWKDAERSTAEVREVSGIHEVSNATVPSGVSAARAIAYLQQQDDQRIGPTAQEYERAIAEISEIKLRLGRQFYEEPRTARIVGPNNSVKVVQFYQDDIPEDVDVRVDTGSSLPKSRVARQNFILELWDKKIIQDPRTALRMLEIGDIEGLYDDVNRDIAQAERENEAMKAGQQVAAHDFDNHTVHIAEHNKFRKGEEYEQLVTQDPRVAQAFAAHVAQHQQAAQAQPTVPTPMAALAGSAAGVPEPPPILPGLTGPGGGPLPPVPTAAFVA